MSDESEINLGTEETNSGSNVSANYHVTSTNFSAKLYSEFKDSCDPLSQHIDYIVDPDKKIYTPDVSKTTKNVNTSSVAEKSQVCLNDFFEGCAKKSEKYFNSRNDQDITEQTVDPKLFSDTPYFVPEERHCSKTISQKIIRYGNDNRFETNDTSETKINKNEPEGNEICKEGVRTYTQIYPQSEIKYDIEKIKQIFEPKNSYSEPIQQTQVIRIANKSTSMSSIIGKNTKIYNKQQDEQQLPKSTQTRRIYKDNGTQTFNIHYKECECTAQGEKIPTTEKVSEEGRFDVFYNNGIKNQNPVSSNNGKQRALYDYEINNPEKFHKQFTYGHRCPEISLEQTHKEIMDKNMADNTKFKRNKTVYLKDSGTQTEYPSFRKIKALSTSTANINERRSDDYTENTSIIEDYDNEEKTCRFWKSLQINANHEIPAQIRMPSFTQKHIDNSPNAYAYEKSYYASPNSVTQIPRGTKKRKLASDLRDTIKYNAGSINCHNETFRRKHIPRYIASNMSFVRLKDHFYSQLQPNLYSDDRKKSRNTPCNRRQITYSPNINYYDFNDNTLCRLQHHLPQRSRHSEYPIPDEYLQSYQTRSEINLQYNIPFIKDNYSGKRMRNSNIITPPKISLPDYQIQRNEIKQRNSTRCMKPWCSQTKYCLNDKEKYRENRIIDNEQQTETSVNNRTKLKKPCTSTCYTKLNDMQSERQTSREYKSQINLGQNLSLYETFVKTYQSPTHRKFCHASLMEEGIHNFENNLHHRREENLSSEILDSPGVPRNSTLINELSGNIHHNETQQVKRLKPFYQSNDYDETYNIYQSQKDCSRRMPLKNDNDFENYHKSEREKQYGDGRCDNDVNPSRKIEVVGAKRRELSKSSSVMLAKEMNFTSTSSSSRHDDVTSQRNSVDSNDQDLSKDKVQTRAKRQNSARRNNQETLESSPENVGAEAKQSNNLKIVVEKRVREMYPHIDDSIHETNRNVVSQVKEFLQMNGIKELRKVNKKH